MSTAGICRCHKPCSYGFAIEQAHPVNVCEDLSGQTMRECDKRLASTAGPNVAAQSPAEQYNATFVSATIRNDSSAISTVSEFLTAYMLEFAMRIYLQTRKRVSSCVPIRSLWYNFLISICLARILNRKHRKSVTVWIASLLAKLDSVTDEKCELLQRRYAPRWYRLELFAQCSLLWRSLRSC